MSNYSKVCDVVNSCVTSRQNNVAYVMIQLYEKDVTRRIQLLDTWDRSWNECYLQMQGDVKSLYELCDENLLKICG